MVSGKYKKQFSEASHILFEGNLNNPFFRPHAIQKIVEISDSVIKTNKGTFKIKKHHKKGEFVTLKYKTLFEQENISNGYPFKDRRTPPPAATGSDKTN